jgi:hypothetical protein
MLSILQKVLWIMWLGEDSGELAHQLEARSDKRLVAVRDFARREKSKSKQEVMNSQPQV